MGQAAGSRRFRVPLALLFLSPALLTGPLSHAQIVPSSPGGITTRPSVWYKPDGATTTAWTDASANSIDLSTNGTNTVTVNAGDAAHNFNSWTTGYSSAKYYLYTSNTNAVFGAYGDTAGGYRYTPLTVFGAARATSTASGAITGLDNDASYAAEPGFGVRAGGGVLNPRFYRFGNGYDAISTTQNIPLGQTSVYLYQPPSASAGTGDLTFGLNGAHSVTSGVTARSSVAGPHLNIGNDGFTFGAFPGDIQEVVWYKATLAAADINKVETYLAIKYGATLTHDYVNNSGTLYSLSTNSGYTSSIAGIMRDDASTLHQKQSNSINTGKEVLIGIGGLANTNDANTGSLTNGQSLMWGDNGLAKIPSLSVTNIPGANYRFPAVWKVQNTASVGVVRVAWPSVWTSFKLVQSSDPTFTAGNTVTDMTANTQTINGVTYSYADVTLADGQYFTFAAFVQTPGGVALPAVWLKADAGTDTSVANGRVSGWQNYGYSGGIAGQLSQSPGTTYDYPYLKSNIHNFNPSLVDSTTNANGGLLLANVFPDYAQRALSTFVLQSQPDITQQRVMLSFGNNINFQSSNEYPWFASQSATQLYFWWDGSYQSAPVLPNSLRRYNNIPTINAYYRRQWTSNPDTTTLSMNGATTIATGNSNASLGIGNHLYINADGGNNNPSGGNISEIISYDRYLTAEERQRVNSYFSIKYGITLLTGNGTGVASYLNSAGDTVWHAGNNSSYAKNIAGIAYDYNSGLNQKQSISENAGKQVLIGTTGLANTNALNTTAFSTDKQFLVWGDNGLERSPAVAIAGVSGANYRFKAIWKVQNTGTVGTVRVAWPKNWDNITLIQSADTTFDGGDVATDMSTHTQTINGVAYNYADVTFTNGQYFTFAIQAQSPGGIAALPAVWYRPDNADSSQWKDASINSLDLTSENGATVKNGDQAHNFHSWTTRYSATSYYNYLDPAATNTDLEVNPVFGNFNTNSFSYMPLTIFGVARDTLTTGGSGLITGIDNEKANASEPGFGVYGAQQRFYRFSYGAAVSGAAAPVDMSAVYMWRPTTGGATAGGTDTLLMGLNGVYTTSQINKVGSVVGPYLKIGYSASDWGAFPGDIQEVIWYKDSLGYSDIQKVETYLALKYGTTLGHNYVAASGATIYNLSSDTTYRYNIAGIGREAANGGLDQRQSNSVRTGKQVLIGTTGLSNTNDSNAVQLTDAQYLVWGDNGRAKSPSVYMPGMANVNVRFKSIWKVQNTGSIGTVRVAWPATDLNNLSLIQSADTTFDASDVVTGMQANTQTINGVTYNYADVTLSNGQYFTFAGHIAHAPGGVFAGLSYWYRADKDAVNTGDSTSVTSWTDYAMGTVASQVGANPYPLYHVGAATYFNFNPGINFTDGNQSLGNLVAQAVADTAYDIFTLTKEGITAGGANPRVFSVLANRSLATGNIHYWDGVGINFDGRLERYNSTSGLAYLANPGNVDFPSNSPGIMYHNFTNNAVSKGLNGARKGASGVSGPYGMINGGFTFGSTVFSGNGSDNYSFKGHLGETIIYGSNNLSPADRNRVDAYLAIKYGITLDTAESYLSSASAVIWDKNASKPYYHNVAGVGRDDLSALFQKQSRSQVTNNPNNQVIMGLGDIYTANLNNPDSIADGQFLIWGDNGNTQAMTNTAATYTVFAYNGSSDSRRMKRTWKVQNTNVAPALKIRFPAASVGTTTLPDESCAQYVILFADDSAFTSNVTAAALTVNGTNYDALHNFPAGASYFTFARLSSFTPGIVYLPGITEATDEFGSCTSGAWTYFHKTGDNSRKVLATSGLNTAQVSNLTVTVTPEGAGYSNGTSVTKLMDRITTIADGSNGTYAGARIRVYYSSSEMAAAAVPGAQTQGWFRYDSYNADTIKTDIQTDGVFNPGKAIALTPSGSGTEDGVPYVEFLNASPFASFVYVSSTEAVGVVLPVTFVSFTARKQGAAALLNWATASETNSKGFSVERSADSKAWNSIGFVNSAAPNGNSSRKLDYSYTDKAPLSSMNYYRLKQTDLDGQYVYSVVRQVSFSNGHISIHPNPASDYVTIDGLSGGESISMYDATGRIIKEIKPVQASVTIDLDGLSGGLYHIHITGNNGTVVSQKVVKVN